MFVRYNIIDMRVNLDDDIGKSKIENIDEIKDLTGGLDYIWVNPKHEKPYKHYHITRFWCLCNKIPLIKDLDIPIAGRFLLLRFKHVFSNTENCPACNQLHKIDDTFESRMKAEPVAEYIIQRAISALHDLIERQSFISQSDVEILDILRLELEPVYAFLNKFCVTDAELQQCTPQAELSDRIVEYLDDEGIRCYIDTQRKFTEQMASY
jgi:phage/plasmid-associated DNA primase